MQGKQQNLAQGNVSNPPELKKSFKARHLTMIALGGSIGTGLLWPVVALSLQPDPVEHF